MQKQFYAALPFVLSLSKHERPLPFESLRANGLERRCRLHQLPGLFHQQLRDGLVSHGWCAEEDLSIATKDFTGPTPPLARQKDEFANSYGEQSVGGQALFCFSAPVCGDLLYKGQKVAGSALRAWRECVLIQGSIQNLPVSWDYLKDVACSTLERMVS